MDKTASSDQAVLWHYRECCEDSNLDRDQYLCAGRDHEKAASVRSVTLHYSANFKFDAFQKTPLNQLLKNYEMQTDIQESAKQLNLRN